MVENGVSTIEMMTVAVKMALSSADQQPACGGGGVEHEGELAALRHQHGALAAPALPLPERARERRRSRTPCSTM